MANSRQLVRLKVREQLSVQSHQNEACRLALVGTAILDYDVANDSGVSEQDGSQPNSQHRLRSVSLPIRELVHSPCSGKVVMPTI